MVSVTILGAGNVAMHLYKAFEKAENIHLVQWFNRSQWALEPFKNKKETTTDISQLKPADLYILAVSDGAIKKLSELLPFKNRLAVHVSGVMTLHELDKKNRRGVFYPLQTLSKERAIDFAQVPICLEAEHKEDLTLMKSLAEAIGSRFYTFNGEQRSALHLAAVFVNNFTNQLYRTAHEIADAKGVDFNILKPLMLETVKKLDDLSPYQAQTGPAVRGDLRTIKKHLKMLDKPLHKELYNLLTQAIAQTHGKKL